MPFRSMVSSAEKTGKLTASSDEFLAEILDAVGRGEPLPDADPSGRIALITGNMLCAENEAALRLMNGFADAGCECCIVHRNSAHLLPIINPSFTITMHPSIAPMKNRNRPSALIYPHDGNWKTAERFLQNYDYILHSTVNAGGSGTHSAQFFPSVNATAFCDGPKERLAYVGVNWDAKRGKTYKKLWKRLDKTDYFDAYGPADTWKDVAPNSWRGFVGWKDDGLLKKLQSSGIALVLHADRHLKSGTPAWRIFEAAAASAVMICDRHPFIIDNFGDSVLYVDQDANAKDMFRQIDGHVRWIRSHPDEAKELARRSHSIFLEKFSLEGEIEKVLLLFQDFAKAKSSPLS